MQILGEIAYTVYCNQMNWKSVRGDSLPSWLEQSDQLRQAWEAAAEAVAEYMEG